MQPDATVTAPIGAVAVALDFAPRTKDRSQHPTTFACGSACDLRWLGEDVSFGPGTVRTSSEYADRML